MKLTNIAIKLLTMLKIALLYKNALGVDRDYKKAFTLFKKTSDQGLVEGHYNLALFYFDGLGVNKDYKLALKFFDLSKEKVFNANYYLGQIYLNGFNTMSV